MDHDELTMAKGAEGRMRQGGVPPRFRFRWTKADRETRITTGVRLLALLILVVHVMVLQTLPDDAFISFRYAHNLAQGYGPVYNPGQSVEGYTTPLWVFILGGLAAARLPIAETATVLCFAAAIATVGLLPRFSASLGLRLHGLDALLLALNTSYAVWAGSAMEMVPFGLLLIIATWAFLSEKPPLLTGLLFALLTLLRPEGALFSGLALFFCALDVVRGKVGAWQRLLWLGIGFAVPVGAHLAWRLAYYGYPLPNTFYAKVGFTLEQWKRGLRYLSQAAGQYLLALTVPLVLGAMQPFGRGWAFLVSGLGLYLLYVSLVGGDHMVSFRLLVPVMVFVVVLVAHGLVSTWQRLRPRVGPKAAPVLAAVGLLVILPASFYSTFTVEPGQPWVRDGKLIAEWLNADCPAGKRLAVFPAGAIAYYAPDFEIVDMFGLNEEEIAHTVQPQIGEGFAGHEKFSAELVLAREPDIFVFQPELGDHSITEASEWRQGSLGHLVRQFTDDIEFWATHSTQTAPMPDGRHFNFVILNPYFCH
jgi:arabinofuranosyltransferase